VNITGHGQYSKVTAGARSLSKIMDMQNKLIFIYPVLSADKVKFPGQQNGTDVLRDFLSITFLKDLFIENFLNMVHMANQVRPLWDEQRTQVDPTIAIAQRSENVYKSDINPRYPIDPGHSHTIQQAVSEKTAVIKQMLKTDPRFSALRPFVEFVTLGNMINLPIIIGTKNINVDTLSVMYFLIGAIGLKRKLTEQSDIDFIYNQLSKMNTEEYYNLLRNINESKKDGFVKGLISWISGKLPVKILEKTRHNFSAIRKLKSTNNIVPNNMFEPLFIDQDKLKQTRLFFTQVINRSSMSKSLFGIDASNETSKLNDVVGVTLSPHLKNAKIETLREFRTIMGTYGAAIIRSFSIIYMSTQSPLDQANIFSEAFDDAFYEKISRKFDEVILQIENSLKASLNLDNAKTKVEILKRLCKVPAISHFNDTLEKSNSLMIMHPSFTLEDYEKFKKILAMSSLEADKFSEKIVDELAYLTNNPNEKNILKSKLTAIEIEISDAVIEIFSKINEMLASVNDLENVAIIAHEPYLRNPNTRNTSVSKLIERNKDFAKLITKLFYFAFTVNLQQFFCQYVLTAETEIETVSHEVTEWPNYVLILPVEIISALYAATAGESWTNIIKPPLSRKQQKIESSRRSQMLAGLTPEQKAEKEALEEINRELNNLYSVKENDIKGVMRFISLRVQIPNLFVVDSKRGVIYYKLMNQNQVLKTKLQTLETFIKSQLDKPIFSSY
jgi:hypothetical protein